MWCWCSLEVSLGWDPGPPISYEYVYWTQRGGKATLIWEKLWVVGDPINRTDIVALQSNTWVAGDLTNRTGMPASYRGGFGMRVFYSYTCLVQCLSVGGTSIGGTGKSDYIKWMDANKGRNQYPDGLQVPLQQE